MKNELTRPEVVRRSALASATRISDFVKTLKKTRYGEKGQEEVSWSAIEYFEKQHVKQLKEISKKSDDDFRKLGLY